MLERTMPRVTFRCVNPNCGEQVTVDLEYHARWVDQPDNFRPWPKHHNRRMAPIQYQYAIPEATA